MQPSKLTIARLGGGWAIKHNGGYLGAVGSEQEARRLAERLVTLAREDGRQPALALADPAGVETTPPLLQALARPS